MNKSQSPVYRFEVRRIEALSNTIFGVGMTLLAYDLPKTRLDQAVPDFAAIWQAYHFRLTALLLSFVISGMFWFAHQRRLAYAPHISRGEVFLNLLFLLGIILLPATTGLYGNYPDSSDAISLYGVHLLAMSCVNLLLWWLAVAPRRDWMMIVGPAFSAVTFLIAAIATVFDPFKAQFIWGLGFLAPIVSARFERNANPEPTSAGSSPTPTNQSKK